MLSTEVALHRFNVNREGAREGDREGGGSEGGGDDSQDTTLTEAGFRIRMLIKNEMKRWTDDGWTDNTVDC